MIQDDLFCAKPAKVGEVVHASYCRYCGAQTRRANHPAEGCQKCGDRTQDTCVPCFLDERVK